MWQLEVWDAWGRGLAGLWTGDPVASDAFLEVERLLDGARVREPGQTPYHAHAVAAHLLAGRRIAASLHLSQNTVATHLRRVYAKLGIPGRARLATVDLDDG